MMLSKKIRLAGLLALAMMITLSFASYARTANAAKADYQYKVHNGTGVTITKLLASDDGKNYLGFDIGAGIKAGQTVTLVWDKSTDNGACEWWIKAGYADGTMSPPAKFDFCEEDLVLEFN